MKKKVNKKKFKFPDFDRMTYKEEAKWWDTHPFSDYWDELEDVDIVFELHKPKTKTIVVRLQENLKSRLEQVARAKGVNVSTLARMWIAERLQSSKA